MVGDYFYEGPLTETWMFGAAPREVRDHHEPFTFTHARRTLTSWVNAVLDAGLGVRGRVLRSLFVESVTQWSSVGAVECWCDGVRTPSRPAWRQC